MNIVSGVITAPGRAQPTIDDTVASLKKAGFDPLVYTDTEQSGCWVSWVRALADLITKDADAILICEDDVAFSPGLRGYLELSLWPEPPNKIAVCSVYCPQLYQADWGGWHLENRGWDLCMAQSWLLPKANAELMYDHFKDVPTATADVPKITPENITRYHNEIQERLLTDSRIGQWALQKGLDIWYHTPSLAQHTAVDNSLIGNDFGMSSLRQATDFDPEATSEQILLSVISRLID